MPIIIQNRKPSTRKTKKRKVKTNTDYKKALGMYNDHMRKVRKKMYG